MKTNVHPGVGVGVIAVVLIVLLALLYRHSFRPSEGSMGSLPPDERAMVMSRYGGQARRPAAPAAGAVPGAAAGTPPTAPAAAPGGR